MVRYKDKVEGVEESKTEVDPTKETKKEFKLRKQREKGWFSEF